MLIIMINKNKVVIVDDDHPLTTITKEVSKFSIIFSTIIIIIISISISIAIITTNNKNSNMERYKVRTTRYFKGLD